MNLAPCSGLVLVLALFSCDPPQTCSSCSETGGGTGSTGGGAATGGGSGTGGGTGCRQIATLETPPENELLLEYRTFSGSNGFYNFAFWGLGDPSAPPFDGFRVEVVYPDGVAPPTPPLTYTFKSEGYLSCQVCAIYHEDCDDQVNCTRSYLAQAGTISIARADRAPAGRIIGSAANVRFYEWNLDTDEPSGNGCIEVGSIGPWDAGWNADGGAPPP
jgi:hypothetical protein